MTGLNYFSTGDGKIKLFNMTVLTSMIKCLFYHREWRNDLNQEQENSYKKFNHHPVVKKLSNFNHQLIMREI